MSDEQPETARSFPVTASLRNARRIGQKCVVTELGDGWLCAHGTDGLGKPSKSDNEDDKKIAPMGSIGIDKSQARVYFRLSCEIAVKATTKEKREAGLTVSAPARALVISPDNTPFRSSSKGFTEGRSKSFIRSGVPVREVLLLYALKTGRLDDRTRALADIPISHWSALLDPSVSGRWIDRPTFGDIFKEIQEVAEDDHLYHLFVGRMMAQAALSKDGLAIWNNYESVADTAAAETRDRISRSSEDSSPDLDARFLQAVRETTIKHGGLPGQSHVRTRWEELANELGNGLGDDPDRWKSHRRKLGFDWLPPLADWKKSWFPLLQRAQKHGG